jgi:hypothetical protein
MRTDALCTASLIVAFAAITACARPSINPSPAIRTNDGVDHPDTWLPLHRETERRAQIAAVLTDLPAPSWKPHTFGPPGAASEVSVRQTPDLDGDGSPDRLMRLRWQIDVGDWDDPWRVATVVVQVRSRSGWRTRAVLIYAVGNGQASCVPEVVDLEVLPMGRIGLRSATTCTFPCEEEEQWTDVLEDDGLRRINSSTRLADPDECARIGP